MSGVRISLCPPKAAGKGGLFLQIHLGAPSSVGTDRPDPKVGNVGSSNLSVPTKGRRKRWSFFMATTYILYSQALDRYYIGHTEQSMEERLKKHLSNHSGFTGRVKDWEIVCTQSFETKSEAYGLERKLKSLKSRIALEKHINARA